MENRRPINPRDCFMTDQRRERLRTNPSLVLTDARGTTISLLFERDGESHLAFAMVRNGSGQEREVVSIADSQRRAICGLGGRIYDRFVMHTTGEVPQGLRFYKADSL